METGFWHERWENNQIGFHESEANPMLVNNFKQLSLGDNARVFIPLCGKTRDIAWLLSKGCRVVGVELSEIAIEQLFAELGLDAAVSEIGRLKHYAAKNIDIFVGDMFDLSRDIIGPVDAIYDRAALVALPEEMRNRYAIHLTELTETSPQLLVCFEYDQSLMEGPPFSIDAWEVNRLYKKIYDLTLITSINLPDGLKGKCAAIESVWLLR